MEPLKITLALASLRADVASGRARLIRERARVSQSEVGRAIGTTGSAIAHWEAGRRVPRGEAAIRYAQLLAELERQRGLQAAGDHAA
jgi:DNA-binding transcriptional regulator YiaG